MPERRVARYPAPQQPIVDSAASALALAAHAAERTGSGARRLASWLLLAGGSMARAAGPVLARLARMPAWTAHSLVMLAGLWLAGTSALTALRAAIGPESGAGVLSASSPAMLAMLLASAAVLLSLHRILARKGNLDAIVLLAAAVVALALG